MKVRLIVVLCVRCDRELYRTTEKGENNPPESNHVDYKRISMLPRVSATCRRSV